MVYKISYLVNRWQSVAIYELDGMTSNPTNLDWGQALVMRCVACTHLPWKILLQELPSVSYADDIQL